MSIKAAIACLLLISGWMVPSTARAQEMPDWFIYRSTTPKLIWLKPLKIGVGESELNQLLKKRHNAALTMFVGHHAEFMAGRGTIEFLNDAANNLCKSRLEIARDKPERLVILRDHIEWTKMIEEDMK